MNIGEKLRKLRLQRELTQEEMADRCELSKGFISQVERDLASPSIATLTDMLECLGSNLKEFFSETEEDEKTVFSQSDMFVKEDEETLRGIGAFLGKLRIERMKVLPYHAMARSKYQALGMEDTMPRVDSPSNETLNRAVSILREYQVNAVSGRE